MTLSFLPACSRLAIATQLLLVGGLAAGCATTMKPVHPPTEIVEAVGQAPFRFDSEKTSFREPGLPLAGGNLWRREVANFTSFRLNELVAAPEDAPVAKTVVTFELQGPSMIQFGTWKEMTIEVRSVLPDGREVRSEPVIGNIDNPIEYFSNQLFTFAGPVLDVAAFLVTIYYFSTGAVIFDDPFACGCIVGLALSGIALNLTQQFAAYLIAGSEERRWSALYAEALQLHALDVMGVSRTPAPVRRIPQPDATKPGPTAPPSDSPPRSELPPPLVLDPAEVSDLEDFRY